MHLDCMSKDNAVTKVLCLSTWRGARGSELCEVEPNGAKLSATLWPSRFRMSFYQGSAVSARQAVVTGLSNRPVRHQKHPFLIRSSNGEAIRLQGVVFSSKIKPKI